MNRRAVRAVRETSGPTVLALDDIPDGYLVGRAGSLFAGISLNDLVDHITGTVAEGSTYNRWYPMAGWTAGVLGTGGSSALDMLRCFPILIGIGHTIEQIAVSVTAAVGASSIRLGIYEDDGNGYPAALVADFGTVSSATTGVKTVTGLSHFLQNDKRYWMAIWQSANVTLRALPTAALFPCNGADSTLGTALSVGWESSQAFGAFPDPYPASATALSGTGAFPVYFARFSS